MSHPTPPATLIAAKRDYVHGIYATLPATARAHGIKPGTLIWHAKRGRWSVLRREWIARQHEALAADLPQPPPPVPPPSPGSHVPEVQRIEAQMSRFNDLLDASTNATEADKLASVLSKLSERRRLLLNIPLPGSHRPSRVKPRPSFSFQGMQVEEAPPEPAAQPPA